MTLTHALGRPEQLSTRIAFFIAGFAPGAWAPLVPFVQARAGLDAAGLGLLLLCLGGGSIVALPLSGAAVARFGARRTMGAATLAMCVALPVLAAAEGRAVLAVALVLFGAGLGSLDSAMNIQAILVERASGRAMMSGFHGLFSVGGIAGAAGISLLLGAGLSPLGSAGCVVACIAALLLWAWPGLLAESSRRSGPVLAWPRGAVLFLGAVCFAAFLAEGAVLDWSAVFLVRARGVDAAYGGLAYAAFAATMTAGRLTGDPVVQRFGGRTVVAAGGCCAAAGFALAALVPGAAAAVLGCALVGAGSANVVPVFFTAAGRQRAMPEQAAVPAITTLGYTGVLAGPAVVGFIAQATSLPAAFLLLALLMLGVAASGWALRDGRRAS